MRRVWLPAVIVLALAGCGSVGQNADRMTVTTTPPGAEAKASTGETCITPCTLSLAQTADFTVVVSKHGFKTERFEADNCASTVDIALRSVASITAFELPDRDLPLIANCGRRRAGRLPPPTSLGPLH